MPKYVGPEGSTSAKMVLIGEAPADEECRQGRPFVGSSGKMLDKLIALAGCFRGEFYITNISKYQAPRNKIANVPPELLAKYRQDLIEEINALEHPKVIIPAGAYALATVTEKNGITNYRGSPLRPKPEIKHDCVVVPTFHPSTMHYGTQYEQWPLIVADLAKAKRIATEGFTWPEYHLRLRPQLDEVIDILDMLLKEKPEMVAIDVETPHELLSWSRQDAICIPFFWGDGRNYWSVDQEVIVWDRLQEVLPQLNLVGQNVFFDWEILHNHKITLPLPRWDSMLMHSCLYSEMHHNLETIVSIYTDMEFYKRDADEDIKLSILRAGKEEDHWRYNCFDSIGCLWSIEELKKDLLEEGMMEVYQNLFADLIGPIFQMNIRGVPVDVEKLPEVREQLAAEVTEKQRKINEAVGWEVNVNSTPQVKKALYEDLEMVPYRNRYGKITSDAKALERLAHKYQTDIPILIKEVREGKKFIGYFDDDKIINGRMYGRYSLSVTKTGRLASRKGFSGGGINRQNIKKGLTRSFFIAEPGHVLIEPDQKQAEARIVAYYSKDEAYIEAAESGELHIRVGRSVYDDPNFTDKDPRYRAVKSLVHGVDYQMGPQGFALAANIPYARAKEERQKFLDTYPGIEKVYYKYVEECVRKDRMLYNVFGRRQVFFKRINDDVIRSACAFIPQSSVADITKIALKRLAKHYIVLLELHDGLILSVPKNEVNSAIQAIHEAFDVPFKIWGIERRIPIAIEIGKNWNEMEKIEE